MWGLAATAAADDGDVETVRLVASGAGQLQTAGTHNPTPAAAVVLRTLRRELRPAHAATPFSAKNDSFSDVVL